MVSAGEAPTCTSQRVRPGGEQMRQGLGFSFPSGSEAEGVQATRLRANGTESGASGAAALASLVRNANSHMEWDPAL